MEKESKTRIYALLAVLVVVLAVNQYLLIETGGAVKIMKITGATATPAATSAATTMKSSVGIPMDERGYQMMLQADREIQLTEEQKKNYVGLDAYIPCCGFQYLQEAGNCECGHHLAMSGVAKYMASKGYSKEEIQAEMDRWKEVFYPGSSSQAAGGLGGC